MAEYVKDVWSTEAREIMPGFRGHFVHSEHTTHVYWDADEGASVPDHSHPHEQMGLMLEGEADFTIGDQQMRVTAGGMWRIPGGVVHKVVALERPVRAIDIFHPPREEYQ